MSSSISISCIFCHEEIVSDIDVEDALANYEEHLEGWHKIIDVGERKKVKLRTLKKFWGNNNEAAEDDDNSRIVDRETLSDKIEKALKEGTNEKNQFTFENEEFVVSASFVNYASSQDDIESNPDATTVERVDFDDINGSKMLECSNVEYEVGDKNFDVENNCEVASKIDDDLDSRLSQLNLDLESEMTGENHGTVAELENATIDGSEVVIDASNRTHQGDDEPTLCDKEEIINNKEGLNQDSCIKQSELNDQVVNDLGKNVLQNDASPNRDIGPNVGVENPREDDVQVCSAKEGNIERSNASNNVENGCHVKKTAVPWYEWGYHRCAECNCVVFLGSIDRHLLTLHETSKEDYRIKHLILESELLIPDYECLVCGVSVPHTNLNIMKHIKLHKLNMGSYFFQFVKGPGGSIKPEVTESNMESEKNADPDKKLAKKPKKSECLRENSFTLFPEEALDSSAYSSTEHQSSFGVKRKSSHPPAPGQGSKRARSSSQHGTLPWYEGSWHKCMECGHVTTMGKFFVSHVKSAHKMGKKEYVDKYPDDDVEISEFWKCKMCGKSITWCVRSIAAHLSKAHSMSKEEYATTFIDPVQQEDNVKGNAYESLSSEDQEQEVDSAQDQDLLMVFDKYSEGLN